MLGPGRSFDSPPIPDPRRYRSARRRRGFVRWAVEAIAAAVALAAIGIGLFIAFTPMDFMRDRLAKEVKARTGRDLVVAGGTRLSVWPLAVSMGEVSLSAPRGMSGPPLIKARRLEAKASLSALVLRRIEIRSLTLIEPVIELRVDGNGRRSWDFAAIPGTGRIRLAQAPRIDAPATDMPPELSEFLRNSTGRTPASSSRPPSAGATAAGRSTKPAAAGAVVIDDVRIANGTVRYHDQRSARRYEARAIDVVLSLGNLSGPLKGAGRLKLADEPIQFDARIESADALVREQPVRVSIAIKAPSANGRFDGVLRAGNQPSVDGRIEADTPSLRNLASRAGLPTMEGRGFGAFSLAGNLRTASGTVDLSNIKASLDGTAASGKIAVALVSPRPVLTANLQTGVVDLEAYTGHSGGPGTAVVRPAAASGAPRSKQTAGDRAAPTSIEDLIRGTVGTDGSGRGQSGNGPQVKGYLRRDGWSRERIETAALGMLDADVNLTLEGLKSGNLKLGPTRMSVRLRNRAGKITIDDSRLYGGRAHGFMTLDGSNSATAVGANLSLDGVAARPLLAALGSTDWVAGNADIRLLLGGRGRTEQEIIDSLGGKAELLMKRGAVIGYDLRGRIASLGRGKFSGFERNATEQTPFNEAGARFTIAKGVATTNDLRLTSADVAVAGAGSVQLGQRRLDLLLRPKLTATPTSGGIVGDLAGLDIPLRLHGPWDQPQVTPDVNAALKNPERTIEAIDKIGRRLGADNLGGVLKGLLGRKGGSGENPPAGSNLERLLNNFPRR